jgi:hypothetical protein
LAPKDLNNFESALENLNKFKLFKFSIEVVRGIEASGASL